MGISINGGTPIAGWFRRENPIYKWMMTGWYPYFRKPPYIYIYISYIYIYISYIYISIIYHIYQLYMYHISYIIYIYIIYHISYIIYIYIYIGICVLFFTENVELHISIIIPRST